MTLTTAIEKSSLTLMTLNMWGLNEWQARRQSIAAWINELRPDLVALQEVVRSDDVCQASWIAEHTGMVATFGTACVKPVGEFGNAVLSRFPVTGSQCHPLTDGATANEPRCVLAVQVDVLGRCIWFASTHLSYRFDEGWVREQQVRDIADLVGEHRADHPPILCGDFNATPASTEVRFIKGLHALDNRSVHFFDAFEVANPGVPGYTWSSTNPFAAVTQVPDQRIDYIFVGLRDTDGSGTVQRAEVVCDQPRGGVWASDHLGVMAELSLNSLGRQRL